MKKKQRIEANHFTFTSVAGTIGLKMSNGGGDKGGRNISDRPSLVSGRGSKDLDEGDG